MISCLQGRWESYLQFRVDGTHSIKRRLLPRPCEDRDTHAVVPDHRVSQLLLISPGGNVHGFEKGAEISWWTQIKTRHFVQRTFYKSPLLQKVRGIKFWLSSTAVEHIVVAKTLWTSAGKQQVPRDCGSGSVDCMLEVHHHRGSNVFIPKMVMWRETLCLIELPLLCHAWKFPVTMGSMWKSLAMAKGAWLLM